MVNAYDAEQAEQYGQIRQKRSACGENFRWEGSRCELCFERLNTQDKD